MPRMRMPDANEPAVAELRAPPQTTRAPRARATVVPAALPDRPSGIRVLLRRQRRRLLRPVLLTVATGIVAATLVTVVHGLANGGTFQTQFGEAGARLGLRVRSIVVEGRQKTPETALRTAIGVGPGDAILNLSLPRAKTRIEAIQWVQRATVERRLPSTLVVRLIERRPFAVWQHDGRFVLIDRDGNTVADSDVSTFAGQVPLVVGPGAPHAAAALLDVLSTQPALMARVAAAVRVGERRWNLRMASGVTVLLPESAAPQALARLLDLQATHALLDRPLQSIDLRLPDRLVLRPVADPAHFEQPGDPTARKPT